MNQAQTEINLAFISNVRFGGEFKHVSNAGFIQIAKETLTEKKKDGTKEESVKYIIEGFQAKDGKAIEIDSHAVENGAVGLRIGGGSELVWKVELEVSIGRYNNKAPAVGHEMYYDKQTEWTKEDLDLIKWLGPRKKYTVEMTLKDNGRWTWDDASAGGKVTVEYNKIDKK